MRQPVSLESPRPHFSLDQSFFFRLRHVVLEEPTPRFFEDARVLCYVTAGYGHIVINGMRFPVSPGAVCDLNSYHVFEFLPANQMALELDILVLDTSLSNYLNTREQLSADGTNVFCRHPVFQITAAQRLRIEPLFQRFAQESMMDDRAGAIIKTGLCGQINIHLTFLVYPVIKVRISLVKVMTMPPAMVRMPLERWEGSWDWKDRPTWRMP